MLILIDLFSISIITFHINNTIRPNTIFGVQFSVQFNVNKKNTVCY